jgi:hypothetical protein
MDTQRSQVRSLSRRRPSVTGSRARRSKPAGVVTPIPSRTDDWWDVDTEILSALASGAKSPEELGAALGMSAHAVTSLVAMLAQQGRVRICLVEVVH